MLSMRARQQWLPPVAQMINRPTRRGLPMVWIAIGLTVALVSIVAAGAYSLLQILGEFSQG